MRAESYSYNIIGIQMLKCQLTETVTGLGSVCVCVCGTTYVASKTPKVLIIKSYNVAWGLSSKVGIIGTLDEGSPHYR